MTITDLHALTDTELDLQFHNTGRALAEAYEAKLQAETAYGPLAIEKYRRLFKAAFPQATAVRFAPYAYENGVFQTFDTVMNGDIVVADDKVAVGEAAGIDIDEVEADLTELHGVSGDFELVL